MRPTSEQLSCLKRIKLKEFPFSLRLFIVAIVLFGHTACTLREKAPPEIVWSSENALVRVAAPELADFGNKELLVRSIDQSLRYLNKLDKEAIYRFGPDTVPVQQVIDTLIDFRARLIELGLSEEFFRYLKSHYDFFGSAASDVLFTGYFEASLYGADQPDKRYSYPLYGVPDDLVRINLKDFIDTEKHTGLPASLRARVADDNRAVPYYSREEIDSLGALANRGLELVWVDDAVAAFFLHIQGSGIVYFEDGRAMRVNFADTNGHPYRALGRLFIDQKILPREEISMQSLVAYLEDNPEQAADMMNYNPSYIFFRSVDEGPIGSIGVPLTPLRSVATDYRLFPRGALAFVRTRLPEFNQSGDIDSWKDFSAFVLNQDTGGAIRGAGRVDLFTGHGERSELLAGPLKEHGELIFLLKKADKLD